MFRNLIAACLITSAAFGTSAAIAEETKLPRIISMNGHGEVRIPPDLAIVSAGVLKQAATAGEALAANTAAMTAVMDALMAAGIESKDIQTSNFMVAPRYDYNQNTQPPKLTGYDVSNTVTVAVRKIDALGSLLDALVSAGSNQINGISFQVSQPEGALDEARKRASEDATRKASLYAAAMQLQLGPVQSISEGTSYSPAPSMMKNLRGAADMAADVPIAGGEQTLSIDVNITWEIR